VSFTTPLDYHSFGGWGRSNKYPLLACYDWYSFTSIGLDTFLFYGSCQVFTFSLLVSMASPTISVVVNVRSPSSYHFVNYNKIPRVRYIWWYKAVTPISEISSIRCKKISLSYHRNKGIEWHFHLFTVNLHDCELRLFTSEVQIYHPDTNCPTLDITYLPWAVIRGMKFEGQIQATVVPKS